jgi:antitoxin VapB
MHLKRETLYNSDSRVYTPKYRFTKGGTTVNMAKLFKNGKSQAVRLPKDFKFDGSEVYVKKIGRNVLLIPKEDPWESLISSLDKFTDDFMAERDQPPPEHRESL